MPQDPGGSRSASRRRSKASVQDKSKQLEAVNGLEEANNVLNEDRSQASRLSFSGEAFQRFADIAQFMSSPSSLNAVDAIERDHGTEIRGMKEIERLKQVISELTYTRSEEMDNLKTEIARLKAEEDARLLERERCKKMRAEMQAEKTAADAQRKQEYDKKVQDDKIRAQKRMVSKQAELEAQFGKQIKELKKQSQELLAEKEKLKEQVVDLQKKAEEMDTRHRHEMLGFQSEHKELELELGQLKSDFSVEQQPVQFYSHRFIEISTAVESLSNKYFRMLPERTPAELENLQQTLSKHTSMFDSILLVSTDASNFVRSQIARSIISNYLCSRIWQPFLTEGSSSDYLNLNQSLDGLSKTLLSLGGRGESAWRVLTLRAIDSLRNPLAESSKIKSTLEQILGTLGPLVAGGDLAQFQEELTDIVNRSIAIWEIARSDKNRFSIEMQPNVFDKERWYAEDIQDPEKTPSSGERPAATTENPICLFPSVLHLISESESVVVCKGCALFPSSYAWNQAILEKKDNEVEMDKAVKEARSKVHARRTSFPNGPNSPTRAKLPASLAANLKSYTLE